MVLTSIAAALKGDLEHLRLLDGTVLEMVKFHFKNLSPSLDCEMIKLDSEFKKLSHKKDFVTHC